MACNDTEYFSGYGSLYLATRDATGRTGSFIPVGDVESFEYGQSQTRVDEFASCNDEMSLVASFKTQTLRTVQMNSKSFDLRGLARALNGDITPVAGSSVTNEAVAFTEVGSFMPLAHPDVTSVVVNKAGSPGTLLVAGTDYEVNALHGTIKLLSSANIGGSAPFNVVVDYTYGSYDQLEEAVNPLTNYVVRLEGVNRVNKRPVIVTLHNVDFDLPETIGWIMSEFGRLNMGGRVLAAPERDDADESQFATIVYVDL